MWHGSQVGRSAAQRCSRRRGGADAGRAERGDLMPITVDIDVMLAKRKMSVGNGSGGVLSSARDLANWLIAQNDQGRGVDETPVVSSAAIAEMRRPSAESSYAVGWYVETTPSGAPLVEHTGGLITITAYQALLPATGYGVVVAANSGSQHGDAADLGAQLIDLIEGRPVPTQPSPTPLVVTDLVLLLLAVGVVVLAAGVRAGGPTAAGPARPPYAQPELVRRRDILPLARRLRTDNVHPWFNADTNRHYVDHPQHRAAIGEPAEYQRLWQALTSPLTGPDQRHASWAHWQQGARKGGGAGGISNGRLGRRRGWVSLA
ncbi:serine hydrolase [Micromonospora sp. NPDC007230]|uniref:serine hydrolase n=1 Tax=Micromonospora sp. NPDC007230 TaxID=3364237 RepID=UPI00367BD976